MRAKTALSEEKLLFFVLLSLQTHTQNKKDLSFTCDDGDYPSPVVVEVHDRQTWQRYEC